ncbi:MAG TPA: serine hydrolase domain-containing protein [Candidatus Limnocylindrales bacterium]|nr:serine hydrolase domain-containing protein [Candidatus Limnocylindrales bacterium]
MTEIRIEGRCDARFEPVRNAFAANFAKHDELGAAVAVTVDGREVVNLWGGYADEARRRPWQHDTLVNAFSVGKGITALCLLVLVDRGLVDLDLPVSYYWPEFSEGDKDFITVRQVLSHQAGLPAVREALAADAMFDWDFMTGALARTRPWWKPGTRHGYHINTFGFLVGEIVRRVSGASIGTFLREELAGPLAADFHIGVAPEDDARVAEFVWLPELAEVPRIDPARLTEDELMVFQSYFNPAGASGHGTVNRVEWRRAEYPSTNGHGTALGVARLYDIVAAGGTLKGRNLIGHDVVAEACREHSSGIDAVLGRPSRFGLGFQLTLPEKPVIPSPSAVLHFGAGGALGFADPDAGIGFGYVMNRMGPRYNNPTNRNLIRAVYASL